MTFSDYSRLSRKLAENAPLWLVPVLVTLGLAGSITAAWLLARDWSMRTPPDRVTVGPAEDHGAPVVLGQSAAPGAPETRTEAGSTLAEPSPPKVGKVGPLPTDTDAPRTRKALSADSSDKTEGSRLASSGVDAPEPASAPPRAAEVSRTTAASNDGDTASRLPTPTSTQRAVTGTCPPMFEVTFASASADPTGPADLKDKAAKLRDWLNTHPNARLIVEGYADSWGDRAFNLQLSSQRAKHVAELLADVGVPRSRLETRALGSQSSSGRYRSQSRASRRVSVRVEGLPRECRQSHPGR